MNNLIESLTVISMRHNYSEFVDLYGYEIANEKLFGLFGQAWTDNKQDVWQWYDQGEMQTTLVLDMTGGK
mgnify:CR=1 FL=1|jgi:hypothetical protein|tara:strand:+ start:118 stop:327 length:210 start_codon:yes stop_codon:yes gene_type:complete